MRRGRAIRGELSKWANRRVEEKLRRIAAGWRKVQRRLPCLGEVPSSGVWRSFSHIQAPETVGTGVATATGAATGFATALGGETAGFGTSRAGAGETAARAAGFEPGIHSRNGFPQVSAISPAATTISISSRTSDLPLNHIVYNFEIGSNSNLALAKRLRTPELESFQSTRQCR